MNELSSPTRSEGLRRIAEFAPRMGRAYAAGRNFDHGPEDRGQVSGLSPWLRRRLILETEVLAAALGAHGHARAQKFVQEVAWRGYFKGWLEHRPTVWTDYRTAVPALRAAVDATRLSQAEEGRTGLAPFDAWARELTGTGYLHNHARMWFASIWIFTLELPWELGADFFLRHLLDGDPASNTCSWRWVAGLHTPGRTYLARASNITRYTDGRFGAIHGLAAVAEPVVGENPPPRAPRAFRAPDPDAPTLRLITEEDCGPETQPPGSVVATATVALSTLRSDAAVSPAVAAWDAGALADAAGRFGGATAFADPDPAAFADWAARTGAAQVATAYLPAGWVRDWADRLEPELARRGLALTERRRAYDARLWPYAKGGFFGVAKKLPAIFADLDL